MDRWPNPYSRDENGLMDHKDAIEEIHAFRQRWRTAEQRLDQLERAVLDDALKRRYRNHRKQHEPDEAA